MSKMIINGFTFNVLKQVGTRVLLSWTESDGITKQRWIIIGAKK